MSLQTNSYTNGNMTMALNEQDTVDQALEESVAHSSAAKLFSQRPNVTKARSVLNVSEENLPDHLSCSTLSGQGMLSRRPIVFFDDDNGALMAFYHVGRKLSGHPKLVHGGLLAVLLDECMGKASFSKLVGKIAVTAKLEISYQSPVYVEKVIVIEAEVTEVQGRKAWVSATVRDSSSETLLVKATGLFIEPKWATDIQQK